MLEGVWRFEYPGEGLLEVSHLKPLLDLLVQIEQRDLGLAFHCHRVASFSTRLARVLGQTPAEVNVIRWAALLHDVGKLRIPEAILNKKGPLNPEEWSVVHHHPAYGSEMVRERSGLTEVALLILAHHERCNGSGYPSRLPIDKIPLGARILAVADSYCAMTDKRVYRASLTPRQARKEILRCTNTDFDPFVVDAFLHVVDHA